MNNETPTLDLQYAMVGKSGTIQLTALLGGESVHADKIDIARATSRDRFAKTLAEKLPAISREDIDAELLRIADEVTRPAPMAFPDHEVDVSRIVRPELFHTAAVSGIAFPTCTMVEGSPVGRWVQYLQWSDGRRERRELATSIDLDDGRPLWFSPTPSAPTLTQQGGWSAASRADWMADAPGREPVDVFVGLCERISHFVDLPSDVAPGTTATLATWAILTYAYPAWQAVPYLNIGGPWGSGKTRVFEILDRVVFRPLPAANATAPLLFRTLNDFGGVLLLDEAERLRENSPDACEIRSILLSGYKRGSPARRLEKVADGFQSVAFDVYGPKAIAGIARLPEALASRCIRITMFRAAPDSDKPRRKIDADPEKWADLRADLHALALENGPTWLELAQRADVCGEMSGRDFELWQPILAIAKWLEESGLAGLFDTLRTHAERTIEDSREDSAPDADEILLKLLAESIIGGTSWDLTAKDILRRAREQEDGTFSKWSAKGVGTVLSRYGIRARKSNGKLVYRDVSPMRLEEIQRAYGLDLGVSTLATCPKYPKYPDTPFPAPKTRDAQGT